MDPITLLEHLKYSANEQIAPSTVWCDGGNFFCRQNVFGNTDSRTQASRNVLHLCVPQDAFCGGKAVHKYDTENGRTQNL